MEPMARWLWLLVLVPFISVGVGKQTPNQEKMELMAPEDRSEVNMDQPLPRPNLATREMGGINDPKHEALRKKLIQNLKESRRATIDADPVMQELKYNRYKTEQKVRQYRQIEERRGKKRKNRQNQSRKSSMKMRKKMQRLRKKPEYAEYFQRKQLEQEIIKKLRGEHFSQDRGENSTRVKRSIQPLVPQGQEIDLSDTAEINAEEEQPHLRKKRFALTLPTSLWPYGVVPYTFDENYPWTDQKKVLMAMKIYEEYTHIRFYPHSSSLSDEVGHNNRLNFISSQPQSCWSHIGYIGKPEQNISCYDCGIETAVHEIGHALGLQHEHQSTLRDNWERINWDQVPGWLGDMYEKLDSNENSAFGRFDFDSNMHYELNIQSSPEWTVNYQPQISPFDEDLAEIMEFNFDEMQHFYSLKDINLYYSNTNAAMVNNPCSSGQTCGNDGYYTSVRGQCRCVCPQGLNSNCDALEEDDPVLKTSSWPLGFAFLKPSSGCPPGFYDTGSTVFKSNYAYMENDWPGEPLSGNNTIPLYEMQLDFCVRNEITYPSEQNYEPGDYCIIKTGETCPPDFSEGSWQFHDIYNSATHNGGSLPSGIFWGETVILDFCCRRDGWVTVPINLPNNETFIMFPHVLKACQNVKGMQADMSSFYFSNVVDGYEPFGEYPHVYKYHNWPVFIFYVCVYTPLSYNGCGGIHTLDENNPTLTIQSPNYPNNYPVNKRCSWIIHSPPDSKMKLKFNSFDIKEAADGTADDYVEIRHNMPANIGLLFYGNGLKRSFVTYKNYLALYLFSNNEGTATGFEAEISYFTDSALCYTGKGENYDGTRAYTRKFKPCIKWSEAAKNCTHFPYQAGDIYDNLVENYCRNPGSRDRPWCYTDSKTCEAQFCDVCNLETCYDFFSDCDQNKYKKEYCEVHGRECYTSCGYCDECFDAADSNLYMGNLWFTYNNQPCQSWTQSSYDDTAFPDGSKESASNFCRDPNGEMGAPWCYTEQGWDYCPVRMCNEPQSMCAPDEDTDCAAGVDLCAGSTATYCAETCGECADRALEVQNYPLACEPPTQLPDADPYQPNKAQYALGEEVTFVCSATHVEIKQKCSTTGQWLPKLNYACGYGKVCDLEEGFEFDNNVEKMCLTVLDGAYYTYDQAKTACENQNSYLVKENDIETTQALNDNILSGYDYWIGLDDTTSEGTFKWADNTTLDYEQWKPGEPFSYKPRWSGHNTFEAMVTWSKTANGEDCVYWSSKTDISFVVDWNFPADGSVTNAGNNCRDPSRSGYIWCYTATSWDKCDLSKQIPPGCTDEIVSETAFTGSSEIYYNNVPYWPVIHYDGTLSQTASGATCARWDQQNYYTDAYFELDGYNRSNANNYCRVLSWYTPWCYTDLTTFAYDTCNVPDYCGAEGFGKTTEYVGTVDFTTMGYACLRWDEVASYPAGSWLNYYTFPDGSLSAAENYCRGVFGYEKPWCYTYYDSTNDNLYWSRCPVPQEEEKQDCVVRKQTSGVWSWEDAYCDELHLAVCEKTASVERTVCKDQDDDCAQKFEEDPSICTAFLPWADVRCALTCGVCTTSNPSEPNTAVTCPDPQETGNFSVVKTSSNVAVGDYIEYKCNTLHTLQSGNLKRGCTVAGTLSGSSPICVSTGDIATWNNDLGIRDRYYLGSSKYLYLGDDEYTRISNHGQVLAWRVYSMAPGNLELIVFRREGLSSSFTVVGKTVVTSIEDKREKTIELKPQERFQVQAGDIIGWGFFSSHAGGIPYDRCKLEYSTGGKIFEMESENPPQVGATLEFILSEPNCRVYSFAVKVGPVST